VAAEVLNCDAVFDGAEVGAGLPVPGESQMRIGGLIDEDDLMRMVKAEIGLELPG
jgi:hypothetical protein